MCLNFLYLQFATDTRCGTAQLPTAVNIRVAASRRQLHASVLCFCLLSLLFRFHSIVNSSSIHLDSRPISSYEAHTASMPGQFLGSSIDGRIFPGLDTIETYKKYKRDTKYLQRWLSTESRDILWGPRDPSKPSSKDHLNMSPKMTLRELVLRAKIIADDGREIPDDIFRLFQAVIAARKEVSAEFRAVGVPDTSPCGKYPKGMDPHEAFINTLSHAFALLGGEGWKARCRDENQKAVLAARVCAEEDQASLEANMFEHLTDEGQSDSDGSSRPPSRPVSAKRPQKRFNSSPGKSKKKTGKRKGKQVVVHSLDSYEIVDDAGGDSMDYQVEARHITLLMVNLRKHCESQWISLYEGQTTGIVVSSICNMAVAMLKRESTSITIEHQVQDSYDRILSSYLIHSGEVKNTYKENRKLSLDSMLPHLKTETKEKYLVFTWEALCEFVVYFQNTLAGHNTEDMDADLDSFKPCILISATKMKDRLLWRRRYAVKWLHDLVSVAQSKHACYLVFGKVFGRNWVDPNVNCRIKLPLGFDSFTEHVAELAKLPIGADFKSRILPQHVLQMQLYLDAFTIKSGWVPGDAQIKRQCLFASGCPALQLSQLTGARGYAPEYEGMEALDFTTTVCLAIRQGSVDIHCNSFADYSQECLSGLSYVVTCFAGVSSLLNEPDTSSKRSRFAPQDSNGLFHYSPYLSGAAMVQMMNRIRVSALAVWDTAFEPVYMLHLYNKLRVRKLLPEMELWETLIEAFKHDIFDNGTLPLDKFAIHMASVIDKREARHSCYSSVRTPTSNSLRRARYLEDTIHLEHNNNYKTYWVALLCEEAGWDLKRIDARQLPEGSILSAALSLKSDTPLCGDLSFQIAEDAFVRLHSKPSSTPITLEAYLKVYELILKIRPKSALCRDSCLQMPCKKQMPLLLLEAAQLDISNETNGRYPILSWNLFSIHMLMIDMLSIMRRAITGRDSIIDLQCAISETELTAIIFLGSEGQECLDVAAQVFKNYDIGMSCFCYWEDKFRPFQGSDKHRLKRPDVGEPELWKVEQLELSEETSAKIREEILSVYKEKKPDLKKKQHVKNLD